MLVAKLSLLTKPGQHYSEMGQTSADLIKLCRTNRYLDFLINKCMFSQVPGKRNLQRTFTTFYHFKYRKFHLYLRKMQKTEEQIYFLCSKIYSMEDFTQQRSNLLTKKWTSSLKWNFLKHYIYILDPNFVKVWKCPRRNSLPSHQNHKTLRESIGEQFLELRSHWNKQTADGLHTLKSLTNEGHHKIKNWVSNVQLSLTVAKTIDQTVQYGICEIHLSRAQEKLHLLWYL